MTLNDIITMSYDEGLFGTYYSVEDAKADSAANILSSHNRRHITRQSPHCKHCTMRKLPPHISIQDNDPFPECGKCEGTGDYRCGVFNSIPCPCRYLRRQPTQEEINSEVQASL